MKSYKIKDLNENIYEIENLKIIMAVEKNATIQLKNIDYYSNLNINSLKNLIKKNINFDNIRKAELSILIYYLYNKGENNDNFIKKIDNYKFYLNYGFFLESINYSNTNFIYLKLNLIIKKDIERFMENFYNENFESPEILKLEY